MRRHVPDPAQVGEPVILKHKKGSHKTAFFMSVISFCLAGSTARCFEHDLHDGYYEEHKQNCKYDAADDEVRELAMFEISLPVCFCLHAKPACKQAADKAKWCDTTFFLTGFIIHDVHSGCQKTMRNISIVLYSIQCGSCPHIHEGGLTTT